MNILIIDDEPRVRHILRLWCEGEGHTVFEAENGLEGVNVQEKNHVDMVICDLIMPVQEGIETITLFRKKYPSVGIIAISGGGRIGPGSYLEVAKQLGAWKTFSKPLEGKMLIEALRQWQTMKGMA